MALPRIGNSERGMLDGIKSRLGFADDQRGDDYDEEYYDDQGEDYEEYAEYADDGLYDDGYGSYDGASSSRRSGYAGSRSSGSSPRLVSMDDVRARTQIPESLNRDPLPERRVSNTPRSAYEAATASSNYRDYSRSSRTVERAADYMISTETSDISPYEPAPRSTSGYDSLFSSTTPSASTNSSLSASASSSGARSYDPYETFSGSGIVSHNPSRALTVLKPMNYGEVERIAKIVKAGDVVVLSLRNTPDQLAKRILDFSFGVSSALDASVECVADKVFVIIRGRSLSDAEQLELRNQGVL